MFNGLNVSCSVQGNRDEREAVDVSLVKQDAQVSQFGVVTFMKLGSLIVFLFFLISVSAWATETVWCWGKQSGN